MVFFERLIYLMYVIINIFVYVEMYSIYKSNLHTEIQYKASFRHVILISNKLIVKNND